MQFLKDLIDSVTKNVNSRLTNPALGSLISSWIFWNWDKLVLLIWGGDKLPERITFFKASLTLKNPEFMLWPLVFTVFYLFIFPYVNLCIQRLQKHGENSRYGGAVDLDITKETKRGELVKAKAIADKQGEIGEEEVRANIANSQADSDNRIAEAKASDERRKVIEAKRIEAETAVKKKVAMADKEEADANRAKIKLEKEQQVFQLASSHHKNDVLSLRFPLSYSLINELSDGIGQDDVRFTVSNVSEVVALTFGYSSFEELLADEKFSQQTMQSVKYVIYSDEELLEPLIEILKNEKEEHFDESWLFEHIQMVLDQHKLQLTTEENAVESVTESIWDRDMLQDLLETDAVNSESAITNIESFEELDDVQMQEHRFVENEGLYIKYSGVISGTSHENKGFCGDSINTNFELKLPLVLGGNCFGDFEIYHVTASVVDWADESDYLEHETKSNRLSEPSELVTEF